MTQRDVMLRWIEQIARVVRRMLLGPGPPDFALVRSHLEDATSQLLGPLAALVRELDVASAAALIHDPERLRGLALLLDLEASAALAEGDTAAAERARERAAGFRQLAGEEDEEGEEDEGGGDGRTI